MIILVDFLTSKKMENLLKTTNDEDLLGAAMAIVRLQKIYYLGTKQLSNGEINGIKYR